LDVIEKLEDADYLNKTFISYAHHSFGIGRKHCLTLGM